MPVTRFLLGWDAPLTLKVREFLLGAPPVSGQADLAKLLIIVPTRQAGRRLRESLARACTECRAVLIPPRVWTPGEFLRRPATSTNAASPTEVAAIWAHTLLQADLRRFRGLFPARPPEQDFSWALDTGRMIQQLRDTLADGGYRIADVCHLGSALEEPERWRDLAELETAYRELIHQFGKQDPIDLMISQASEPLFPNGVTRIVLAAVPDPTPLMVRALENLQNRVPIEILVHAPESLADHFDPWGRPLPEKWRDALIEIPYPEANIVLAGTHADQSRRMIELIAQERLRFGPEDIAIGVPDHSIVPQLTAALEEKDLPPFDPEGKPVSRHPLFNLLDHFHALVTDGNYKAFSAFLRQSAVLERLGLSPYRLLSELDHFQNEHLPQSWDYLAAFFTGDKPPAACGNLANAVTFTGDLVEDFRRGSTGTDGIGVAVRSLLKTVYAVRSLDPARPEDEEFVAVAEMVDDLLREVESEVMTSLNLGSTQALALFAERLGSQKFYPSEREGCLIDLEGWLELPWNDAPLLIVTGMNEGMVSRSRTGDVFLPDSLRTLLNLPNEAERLATDTYLMRTLVESRRDRGRCCFIAGKTAAAGEPLIPSRLLFRCPDEELPERALRLFGDPREERDDHPPRISFRLKPGLVEVESKSAPAMSVTRFKDYLSCPFRFYLKHVLGMQALDDRKGEMDAADFGMLVHHALREMAQNHRMRRSENEGDLSAFLADRAADWVRNRFGNSPPLQVQIQLDSAIQRLAAASRVQTELVRQGWDIERTECQVEMMIQGIKVAGRIDRIDRHIETGRIRVLDYKTSEKAAIPESVHLVSPSPEAREYARAFIAGKEKRWADLQLPLYGLMLCEEISGPVEFGYFNLPKATSETGLTLWESLDDRLMASARACAEGIVEDFQNGRFWPPATRVQYDEFAALFPAAVADCIDWEL